MGVGRGIGEVVDDHRFQLIGMEIVDCFEDLPAHPAKAIDANLCCHPETSLILYNSSLIDYANVLLKSSLKGGILGNIFNTDKGLKPLVYELYDQDSLDALLCSTARFRFSISINASMRVLTWVLSVKSVLPSRVSMGRLISWRKIISPMPRWQ